MQDDDTAYHGDDWDGDGGEPGHLRRQELDQREPGRGAERLRMRQYET
jgi:hypothetical protein